MNKSEKEELIWAITQSVVERVSGLEGMPSESLTVGQAIDKFIEARSHILSPSTVVGYKRLRKNVLQELMNVRIDHLAAEIVQTAVNSMAEKYSSKYVKNAYGLVSAALRAYAPYLILHIKLPPKEKTDIRIPTTEEIKQIENHVRGKRFELPFLLGAWLGLRRSEILGLTWDCFDGKILHVKRALVPGPDGYVLSRPKTYTSDRKLVLHPYLRDLIAAQPRVEQYIVHYNANQLLKAFERYCKQLGLPHYRFHDLRHYQASIMLALGVPDKYAMKRMGHSSNNMLKTVYQHTISSKEQEVTEQIDNYFTDFIGF